MTFLLKNLFHDEIAEILRSLPAGSVVTVPGSRSVRVSCSPVNDDGIIATDRRYVDTRSRSGSGWCVPASILIDEIYDAIESGRPVTVNNNILNM